MSEYQWKAVSAVGFDELMEALERADRKGYMPDAVKEAWEGFNWKPAQQQEPVAWMQSDEVHISLWKDDYHTIPLYTSPQPSKPWVGLTDEEIYSVLENLQVMHHRPPTTDSRIVFARAIEAKLKEKNT